MKGKFSTRFFGFQPAVFREGFRQLRLIGILSLVIFTLEAILVPIGRAISSLPTPYSYQTQSSFTTVSMHPLLPYLMLLAPIMVIVLFQFLNHRSSSDFYHSMPVSRTSLFFSLFAAVMVWILLIEVVSTAASVITTLCFPTLFRVIFADLPSLLLSVLAGSLLTAGCAAVAMSITGNLFTNLLVTGLLFATPRLLLLYVSAILRNVINIIPNNQTGFLLDSSYNIPFGTLASLFSFTNSRSVLIANWEGCLYTALVGILLVILANFLLQKRHSEAAGKSASTPLLQTVYRLLITFLITLIPVGMMVGYIAQNGLDARELFSVLVLYLIAAIAFCVYELITTKKPRLLLKAAPSFLIVLAADAVLLVGLVSGYFSILSFQPTANEIQSISVSHPTSQINDYFNNHGKKVQITDRKIAKLMADRLEIIAQNNSPNAETGMEAADPYFTYQITFRTAGVARERSMMFTSEQEREILDALAEIPSYQSVYTLPQLGKRVTVSNDNLTQEQAESLYRVMIREINALPFQTRYTLLHSSGYYSEQRVDAVNVQVNEGNVSYFFQAPIVRQLTPESFSLYFEYAFKAFEEDQEVIRSALQEMTYETFLNSNVQMLLYLPGETEEIRHINLYSIPKKDLPLAVRRLEAGMLNEPPRETDAVCRISMSILETNGSTQKYDYKKAYFSLSERGLAQLEVFAIE